MKKKKNMQLHGFFLKRERKEAQETIYETLIEIMKKEENCELGALFRRSRSLSIHVFILGLLLSLHLIG